MKKFVTLMMALLMVLSFAGCKKTEPEKPEVDIFAKGEGVMTYAEYDSTDLKKPVTIETFVQAKQGWWENAATIYTQDKDGGYFLYSMPISQEDYAKLTEGTKIKVTGTKDAWAGEVEITDATFEIMEGTYVAEPTDITKAYGTPDLQKYMNLKIAVKGLKVVAYNDAGDPFEYGGGIQGNDIYFTCELNGANYNFCIESYLTDSSTDVYKAAEALKVGDTIDIVGFLYWYNGAEPHVTQITVK